MLVDTGPSGLFGPTTGRSAETFAAYGIAADSIDAVMLPHAHVDQIGSMVVDGRPAHPAAEVYRDRRDVAEFTTFAAGTCKPDVLHSSFAATARLVEGLPRA